MTKPLVITGGDPAGIGPELVESVADELFRKERPVVYLSTGGPSHLGRLSEKSGLSGRIRSVSPDELLERGVSGDSPLFHVADLVKQGELSRKYGEDPVEAGRPGERSGALAFESLKLASDFILRHGCSGLLTPPLSKEWVARSLEVGFSGHTGYLAERFGRTVLMLMHGEPFSVIPLTEHVPFKDVPGALRRRLEDPVLADLLVRLRRIPGYEGTPWALTSLNPHGGEGGRIGTEEAEILSPWLNRLKERGVRVEGPLAADALFMKGFAMPYRLILSPYHDQALIPFKALVGAMGVNVTLGLPFLRCSPDHGTAYNIAGKGEALDSSMRKALELLDTGTAEWNDT